MILLCSSYQVLTNMPLSLPTINIFYAQDWGFSLSFYISEAGDVPSAVPVMFFQVMLLLQLLRHRLLCITNLDFGNGTYTELFSTWQCRDSCTTRSSFLGKCVWMKGQTARNCKPSLCKYFHLVICAQITTAALSLPSDLSKKVLRNSKCRMSNVSRAFCYLFTCSVSLIGYVWTASCRTTASAPVDLIYIQNIASDSPILIIKMLCEYFLIKEFIF